MGHNSDLIRRLPFRSGDLKRIAFTRSSRFEIPRHVSDPVFVARALGVVEPVVVVHKSEAMMHPCFVHAFNPGVRIFDSRIELRQKVEEFLFRLWDEDARLVCTSCPDVVRAQRLAEGSNCHDFPGFISSARLRSVASRVATGIDSLASSLFHAERSIITCSTVS